MSIFSAEYDSSRSMMQGLGWSEFLGFQETELYLEAPIGRSGYRNRAKLSLG